MNHSHLPPLDGRYIRTHLNDTTAGRSHGKLEPLLTKRNLWPATGAFLCLLSMGAVFWFAWGMT